MPCYIVSEPLGPTAKPLGCKNLTASKGVRKKGGGPTRRQILYNGGCKFGPHGNHLVTS